MDRHLTTLKSVGDIIKGKYIIPDFQRDFVWEKKILKQMLDDISEAQKDGKEKYLLGSIVISHDGKVIDGQQRLTSLKLILIALGETNADFLGYENRNHVASLLKRLAGDIQPDQVENDDCRQCLSAEKWPTWERNEHEQGACRTCHLLLEMHGYASAYFTNIDKGVFCTYLKNNVCFIEKRLPEEAGIQHAFEVLNTVGEQLRKEDIAKAKLISKIHDVYHCEEACNLFNYAWMLCYDIENDLPANLNRDIADKIQKAPSYNELYELMKGSIEDSDESTSVRLSYMIDKVERGEYQPRNRIGTPADYRNGKYSVCLEPEELIDLALEESIHQKIGDIAKSAGDEPFRRETITDMIRFLLLYRIAFDLLIRRSKGTKDWEFSNLNDCFIDNGDYKNRLVKIESMMAVSGTAASRALVRTVKESMVDAIANNTRMQAERIIGKLEEYAMKEASERLDELDNGTRTNHFVFHWLDYLLYIDPPDEITEEAKAFTFIDTTSVEHFKPQNQLNGERYSSDWQELLDTFGNLALITPSSNSRLNNSSPREKAGMTENRPPESLKYALMLKIARDTEWTVDDCRNHGKKMRERLRNPKNLLCNTH